MSLSRAEKEAIVTEVRQVAEQAHSVIGAEYSGLNVGDLTQLRKTARASGVYLRVVKNTLARRALKDTEFACLHDGLVGPLLLAFSQEDPGAAARIINEFTKSNEKLVVKLIALGGRLLAPGDLAAVANLPTREEAISKLMAVMKAPIVKLARTLAEPHAKLVRTLAAVRDQKQAA